MKPSDSSGERVRRMPRNYLLPMALLAALAAPARAHPHAWVEMNTDLVFTPDGLIKGLGLIWVFDDGYAQAALDGLDTNKDGDYSEAEIAPLTAENIKNLKDYNYFALVRFNNEKQLLGEVPPDGAKQIWKNGKLALRFFVPLKTPLDPRKGEIVAKVYDPDYFIAFDYAQKEPFHITGAPPRGCKPELKPVPTEEDLQQTRDFLATKGKDWTPPPDQDFGEMFAQALTIACAKS
jgi:ABC-type uncharacterized transport system substrate-binding protein